MSKPEAVPGLTMFAESRGKVSARSETLSRRVVEGLCQHGADVGDAVDLAMLSLLNQRSDWM